MADFAQFSAAQILWIAEHVAHLAPGQARTATGICIAESSGIPGNWNQNTDAHRSIDRGLWMINNYWHPDVSDRAAYTPRLNAQAMESISGHGGNWSPWATFNSGAYLPYVPPPSLRPVAVPASLLDHVFWPAHAPRTTPGLGGLAPPVPPPPAPGKVAEQGLDYSPVVRSAGSSTSVHAKRAMNAIRATHQVLSTRAPR